MTKAEKLRSEIDDKYKWDLSRIFIDDQEATNAIERIKQIQSELLSYKGKIMRSGDNLYSFLKLYDNAMMLLEEVEVYFIYGMYKMDSTNSKNQKNRGLVENLVNCFYNSISFVNNEIINGDYNKLIKENKCLIEYQFYLENITRYKPYILSEKEENLLSHMNKIMSAGVRTYDNMLYTDANYGKIKDDTGKYVYLNNSNYSKLMYSDNRLVRKRAYKKRHEYYKEFRNTLVNSILQSVREHQVVSKIRGYESMLQAELFNDNIPEKVYFQLIKSVSNNTESLKKYYDIKRQLLGYDRLYMYDFNVMPQLGINNHIDYKEAIKLIKQSLMVYGFDYSNTLSRYLDMNLIDVYPNKGKNNGGYQIGLYRKGPFISYNYDGSFSNMFGLVHEIGHAMHSHYSSKNQPYSTSGYGYFLAEVASLTNEVLLMDFLVNRAETKNQKIFYLMKQIEEIDHYLFNVLAEVEQEKVLYDSIENSQPMSVDEICNSAMKIKEKYYKSKYVIVTEESKYSWMKHNQYHVPYYFYKYAIDMIVALIIGKRIINNEKGFKDKYINFLCSGSSNYPIELFKKLDIDLTDNSIYKEAIDYFESRVNLLQDLINE